MALDRTATTYTDLVRGFAWTIPEYYNIGVDVCDRHALSPARANNPAVIAENDRGQITTMTFARLKTGSDRLANALRGLGINKGDRVAVLLPQRPETLLTLIALFKVGAVAVPLYSLFGAEALAWRLIDAGAEVVVTDSVGAQRVLDLALPTTPAVISVDADAPAGVRRLDELLTRATEYAAAADTLADDPALLLYTSGTTGTPRGALLAQRTLLAHLPGVELPHGFLPHPDDLFWTPTDWAWIGGLLNLILPALYHGIPVLACRGNRFDPEAALALMARHRVRNAFLPPTALRLLRQLPPERVRGVCTLRSIAAGGEPLGPSLLDWGRDTLGVTINEVYGQTECNIVICNSHGLFPVRPGSMGRTVPGHRVAIIDEHGQELPPGHLGKIAIHRPDPAMFLGYWNNPEATAEKFVGDWMITGDVGRQDADGYFWFVAREDDVIISSGYRISPAELEDVLGRHPAVAQVAVIGVPDTARGSVVKAFVVPRDLSILDTPLGRAGLARDIQDHARSRYAAHAYPRQVEFLEALPTSATGKIRRRELRQQGG
ncbi:AMP-binding protein [Pararhodospirillum photometricum]|uniref:Acyl-coenzyme A synthetase/AMP-(Fatty) acid ligase n=1 Tax=Pararhodospirillum photometricum DSM 122 TaxID=1150469 RepID=H6SKF1_PARPM|nr:AMP-binding protein [Pararhodospirillum photometricum]CCG08466.1 Acyl-coenzyme A synthetase/AMP-(Fatty) acid ligase [Pararhodospirillum photometricum DSM 122]